VVRYLTNITTDPNGTFIGGDWAIYDQQYLGVCVTLPGKQDASILVLATGNVCGPTWSTLQTHGGPFLQSEVDGTGTRAQGSTASVLHFSLVFLCILCARMLW